ncbi:MAG: Rho termination factor N-terminal domain-containing protein [Synechococcales cyanobacterium T60_A2020_003]|nr:Rho termination factor N-terminal domain-containing protein [Synechococcales cyanobacterium T60_A2020_003]
MFNLLNIIDAGLGAIAMTQMVYRRIQPKAQQAWKLLTAEKTQRLLRAIGLAVLVVITIVLLGMVQVMKLAWQEAQKTIRVRLAPEEETGTAASGQEQMPMVAQGATLISAQMGVRALRQLATQQGIRNAARMRKSELLERLGKVSSLITL